MGRATLRVMDPGLVEAKVSVYRKPDLGGVLVLLPIVFPPADRAQGQRAGCNQSLASAARTAK
jgi:hypothetical protein